MGVNLIFSENLRELCNRRGTAAQIARDLEISRVQMGRFLAGTAHPKPGLLKRICDYFGVDGRVLLEPLGSFEKTETAPTFDFSRLFAFANFGRDPTIQSDDPRLGTRFLPDGIHLTVRPSFFDPTKALRSLVLIKDFAGRRTVKGFDAPSAGVRRRDLGLFAQREWRGTLFRGQSGFGFAYTNRAPTGLYGIDFYSTNTIIGSGFYVGYNAIFIGNLARPVVPIILQPLRQNISTLLEQCRKPAAIDMANLDARYRSALTKPLFGP